MYVCVKPQQNLRQTLTTTCWTLQSPQLWCSSLPSRTSACLPVDHKHSFCQDASGQLLYQCQYAALAFIKSAKAT